MEIICLDTDILIDHRRAKQKNDTRLFHLAAKGYEFAVTSITIFELLKGDNSQEDIFWKNFFERVSVFDFDYSSAEIAGRIFRELKSKGQVVAVEDLLIGSVAIKNNLRLASNNKKHFDRIVGLRII